MTWRQKTRLLGIPEEKRTVGDWLMWGRLNSGSWNGWSRPTAAERLGTNPNTLAKYEIAGSGKPHAVYPPPLLLAHMWNVYGLPFEKLGPAIMNDPSLVEQTDLEDAIARAGK